MAKLIVNQEKITNINDLIKICPFGAIENKNGEAYINSGCKMCKLCVKKGPEGAVVYIEDEIKTIDKSKWVGISVYVDHMD